MRERRTFIPFTTLMVVLSAALVGCGSESFKSIGSTGGTYVPPSGNTGEETQTPEFDDEAAIPMEFGIKGTYPSPNSGHAHIWSSLEDENEVFDTDSIFRIKIKAGPADYVADPISNSIALPYNCARFKVKVRTAIDDPQNPGQWIPNPNDSGLAFTTKNLRVAGQYHYNCSGSQGADEQVLNYDSRATSPFPLIIEVSDASTDFYCYLYDTAYYSGMYWIWQAMGSRNLYCPMKSAYKHHSVTAEIKVLTNTFAP